MPTYALDRVCAVSVSQHHICLSDLVPVVTRQRPCCCRQHCTTRAVWVGVGAAEASLFLGHCKALNRGDAGASSSRLNVSCFDREDGALPVLRHVDDFVTESVAAHSQPLLEQNK